jgi:hypothetical protein
MSINQHLNSALLAIIAVALVVLAVDQLRRPRPPSANDIAAAVALSQAQNCVNGIPKATLEP